ncbi:MAG: CBASS oligonucleotide cyclase [Candidatus Zhuqueibacterota bacterium]
MAKTILESFNAFKSNLEITNLQTATVSARQQTVRTAVENGLTVSDSFLSGSYSRQTLIAPLKQADIDIVIILDPKYFHNYNGQNGGQAGLLDLLKRVLKKTYSNTPDISRNGQAVTIRFTDFVVDVVPAFNRQGGGYLIPNSITQSWLSTDPKEHIKIWSAANQNHNADLVPLMKMLKSWNRATSAFLRSFHLETMTLQILNNVTISDFPSGVMYFFGKGKDYVTKKNPDPAGYGDDVGGYLNSEEKIKNAVSRFETAHTCALKAEDFARRGYVAEAVDMWRMIFGDYFPAYG